MSAGGPERVEGTLPGPYGAGGSGRRFRGTLEIESSPGAGTSVPIRIPIPSSEEGPR